MTNFDRLPSLIIRAWSFVILFGAARGLATPYGTFPLLGSDSRERAVNMAIDVLERLFAKVIHKLKAADYSPEWPEKYDEYRHAGAPECYDLTSMPELRVGSLQHDCDELNDAVLDPEVPLGYVEFDRLAAVLIAISHELSR